MFSQDPQETDGKCYRRKRGEIGGKYRERADKIALM